MDLGYFYRAILGEIEWSPWFHLLPHFPALFVGLAGTIYSVYESAAETFPSVALPWWASVIYLAIVVVTYLVLAQFSFDEEFWILVGVPIEPAANYFKI